MRYAADDLETAHLLMTATPPKLRQALFAAQQAAEKAIAPALPLRDFAVRFRYPGAAPPARFLRP